MQAAEKAVSEQSEKAKEGIAKAQKAAQAAQQAMQAAQLAKSLLGGGGSSPLPNNAGAINGINGPVQGGTQAPAQPNNAAAVAAGGALGVMHIVAIQIVIDGNVFNHFQSFQLQQSAMGHHGFSLVMQNDALPNEQDYALEDARNFLGKRISVTYKYKNIPKGSPEREFIGIITEVGFTGEHGNHGSILLTGYSPTALLDGAPHTQSFGGEKPVSLATIADTVIKQGLGATKFDVAVKPSYTGNLPYSSQYNESHFNYLARMAAAYGEWFFYDGSILHFGKPAAADPIKLVYGKDVTQVRLQMRAVHVSRQHYGYNSSNHKPLSTGDTPAKGLGELGMFAHDASQKVFTAPSLTMAPVRAVTDKDVETTQKSAIGAAAAEVFTLSGSTSIPFLYPGCLIEMNFKKPDSNDVKYFSRLIVTEVSHSVDALGQYSGRFEAIPSDTEYLPAPAFSMPAAEPQLAIVKDNKDKENKGRIRVQFDWQKGSDTTDFIRMMSPDAGGSDKVSTNRGFMAVPEEGDQVMVGFVHNHPDRPFAMGGMFHGKVGAGGGGGNNVKSLSSKSGHTVTLDDGGGITIVDKDQNIVSLDGAGNIAVTSKLTVMINSKDIAICASNDMVISAGNNLILFGNAVGATATTDMTITGNKVGVGGVMELNMGSPKVNLNGTATTIAGDKISINGKDVIVAGDLVKINS